MADDDRSTSEAPAREPSVEPFDARFSNQEAEAWTVGWSPENSLPYYSNALLGQTTWEPPTDELRAKGDAMRVAAAWTVGVSPEHNLPYYSNALLGETTWEPPTEELAEYGRALALAGPIARLAETLPSPPQSPAAKPPPLWSGDESSPDGAGSGDAVTLASTLGLGAAGRWDPTALSASEAEVEALRLRLSHAESTNSALRPATADAAAEEPPPSDDSGEVAEAREVSATEAAALLELSELKRRFGMMRRRSAGLEARLESEGVVLLRAFRSKQEQLALAERAHAATAVRALAGRDAMAARVVSSCDRGLLRLVMRGWRQALSLQRAEAAAQDATAAAEPELYRLSYEALIDTVLEWQSAVCPEPG
ncbi:hypothetical protein EMIHUDRAFT_210405 [Emiliania huxleyi CCMP1516]|uniref:WW domain-containing protein n=2 Tax=Emiliania huxleyi TaxID=2903 RepID=A0A0D3IZY9_EMIH1|nr:hypothetical protein EMIHUDRAFT_210405 [Emiliania huxleyi CCMP1516]EOD16824.1 hypothetical protein EMIHUDRAFT_210405 [Emiliania huxleyi CCMP1516]|eukprot:XP_005769253.1 hypothetical protein EMIHUDRAFT_210405 [Emiliania huxleyi CCMP1516]